MAINKLKLHNQKEHDSPDMYLFTLQNSNGITITISNYGGIITSLIVPDKNGNFEDIVLGFDEFEKYLQPHPYIGVLVGRYANRISKARFELNGKEYILSANNGNNHLHGGIKGFDKRLWKYKIHTNNNPTDEYGSKQSEALELTYLSPDQEEGYPGNLHVQVTFLLNDANELIINYNAATDQPTPLNLTNHTYFNLTASRKSVLEHRLMIDAGHFTEVDSDLIPTGVLPAVAGTPMDFNTLKPIGRDIEAVAQQCGGRGGYDHNYVLNKRSRGDDFLHRLSQSGRAGTFLETPGRSISKLRAGKSSSDSEIENKAVKPAALLYEPQSGRVMSLFTTQPGLQLYSGNNLNGKLKGKDKIIYHQHWGLCLETQHFPNSPNQPEFPDTILYPGQKYQETTILAFGTVK